MSITSTIFFGLIAGIAITIIFEFILKSNKKLRVRFYKHHLVVAGYHIHHSTYGILFIIASILLYKQDIKQALFYFFFGIGIIIQHTLSANGRLVFVERWRTKY